MESLLIDGLLVRHGGAGAHQIAPLQFAARQRSFQISRRATSPESSHFDALEEYREVQFSTADYPASASTCAGL